MRIATGGVPYHLCDATVKEGFPKVKSETTLEGNFEEGKREEGERKCLLSPSKEGQTSYVISVSLLQVLLDIVHMPLIRVRIVVEI